LGATGNYLGEEPFCTYQPDPRAPRELINVQDLLSRTQPHEGRFEAVPNKDFIPPAF
jgi:hypothetical protein